MSEQHKGAIGRRRLLCTGMIGVATRFNTGEMLVFWFALGAAAVAVSGALFLLPFYVTNIGGPRLTLHIRHPMIETTSHERKSRGVPAPSITASCVLGQQLITEKTHG
jgi:hypothetical protein